MKEKRRIWSILEWVAIILWFLYWIAFAVLSIVFKDDADFSQKYGLIIPAIGIGVTVASFVARILNKVINKRTGPSKRAAAPDGREEENRE